MKRITLCLGFLMVIWASIFGQCLNSEESFKDYFQRNINNLDQIEGIWKASISFEKYYQGKLEGAQDLQSYLTYAIIKDGEKFRACNLDRAEDTEIFTKTAANNIYLYEGYINIYGETYIANAHVSPQTIEYRYEVSRKQVEKESWETYSELKKQGNSITELQFKLMIAELQRFEKFNWIKIFPTQTDYVSASPSSATGFAISSNGIIVTNSHVVEGSKDIKVRGVNGDFSKTFNAKVLVKDKVNDLALIQIQDQGFTSCGTIPFTIKNSLASVGENIFVFGYPLRASMGDEIKLTNGIVSSKTGYQGDITCYQISAPVQPGNSGGPLFDSNGNLIGIVNSKLVGAENASYAIKTSYLMNLIELLPSPPKLQTVSSVNGKSLTSQVQILKKFVYIIEVN